MNLNIMNSSRQFNLSFEEWTMYPMLNKLMLDAGYHTEDTPNIYARNISDNELETIASEHDFIRLSGRDFDPERLNDLDLDPHTMLVYYDFDCLESNIDNLRRASEFCAIEVVVEADDLTPYDLMVQLRKCYPRVDDVRLRFHHTPVEEQYAFFREIRDALSSWKMKIILEYTNDEDLEVLKDLRAKDRATRIGLRDWKNEKPIEL